MNAYKKIHWLWLKWSQYACPSPLDYILDSREFRNRLLTRSYLLVSLLRQSFWSFQNCINFMFALHYFLLTPICREENENTLTWACSCYHYFQAWACLLFTFYFSIIIIIITLVIIIIKIINVMIVKPVDLLLLLFWYQQLANKCGHARCKHARILLTVDTTLRSRTLRPSHAEHRSFFLSYSQAVLFLMLRVHSDLSKIPSEMWLFLPTRLSDTSLIHTISHIPL